MPPVHLLLKLHLVDDTSNSFHIDLNLIPILHEPLGLHEQPNPTRRTSQDRSPSPECSATTQMYYDLANIEDHIIGLGLLPNLPIDLRPIGQLLRIANYLFARDAGTNGRELVEALGVSKLASRHVRGELVVTRADVVAHSIAQDVVGPVVGGGIFAVPTNDDG